MNTYVADTHALFWYLTGSPKLGTLARNAFEEGVQGKATIFLPSIFLAELYFLNEKLSRPLNFNEEFERLNNAAQFQFWPFNAEYLLDFDKLPSLEMHDRIIVQIALQCDAPCLTRDRIITGSNLVHTIW